MPDVYADRVKIAPIGAVATDKPGTFPYQLGEVACWRAHADIWRQMLKDGHQTTFIMEADVDFQVNIREELAELPDAICRLQQQLLDSNKDLVYNDNDLYRSESLQLGWCMDNSRSVSNGTVVYNSSSTFRAENVNPSFFTYRIYEEEGLDIKALTGKKLKMLRVSLGSQCTTANAVSRLGAKRLLHKQTRS